MHTYLMTAPSNIPHEPSETEVKVAAADAAQVTADTAQKAADDFRKAADDAIASDVPPSTDTTKINLRDVARQATQSAIIELRRINESLTPK